MRVGLSVLLAFVAGTAPALAAPIEDFQVEGVSYDEAIETPDEHFRHGLGDKPVRHDQLVSYLTGLSEASDRLQHEVIGYTHEGRPILFFTVSSPENLSRLDEIKEAHVRSLTDGAERPGDLPAVIWINYGVHGAESAGMDAAIPTLYHYAAAEGDEVERQLEESVILIVAILNPDGHSRRADHVETFSSAVPVTDPAHAQHQLWTAARTNHYWFDLNRQWLPVSQPESRAWVGKWQEWKPMVSADFHEMGSQSTFYFHPGEPKRLNPLIPDEARVLTKRIGESHREFLDSESRLYFTEQGFDNFYVGKGSTYPQVNGGLGILFEIGAARGGQVDSPSGQRDYADNIRTHFRTSLTTVEGTLDAREEIAAYQQDFFRSAMDEASRDGTKAYVFTTRGDQERLRRFLDVLAMHRIEVHRLEEEVSTGNVTYQPGESFVVPLEQPQYRMVRAIFDRLTEFEENVFYDVSGWTLPLAYDLDYAPLRERVARGEDGAAYDEALIGQRLESVAEIVAAEAPEEAEYGYIFSWDDRFAARALYRLLSEDVLVRVAREPFEVRTTEGLRNFESGAVFVPMIRQDVEEERLHELMRTIAQEDGIDVHSATSGAGDIATASLGGRSFEPVEEPNVLLLFGDGLARYDAGEVWHLLDFEMRMPVTLRRKDELGGLDWSRYTHLIMVGGGGVALADDATERVRQWIREDGGTLIALRQSAHWAQEAFLASPNGEPETEADGEESGAPQRIDYSEMDIRDAEHVIGGAIVATDLDTSHPLGFGYKDRMLPVLRNTTLLLDRPEANPYAVVAEYPEEDMLLSGYVSDKRVSELSGTPAVVAQGYGEGAVVLMADNPVFRGMFLGTNKMFLNAIFFSDLIDNPYGDYTALEE